MDKLISKYEYDIEKVLNHEGFDRYELENRMKKIRKYQKELDRLITMPKVEQKSDEWYRMRENMITASDFAQALGHGKFGSVAQFYQKKVDKTAAEFKSNPFFEWGNMFEPVAINIYSLLNEVFVYEFGLLPSEKYPFFGASPDGISSMGIMVEIKCPMRRKINGEVPKQYYYQMQGQLDVCNLEECDYFECEFDEMTSCEFKENFPYYEYKGIIIEMTINGKKTHEYSDIGIESYDELIKWSEKFSPDLKRRYWVLLKHNTIKVIKDKEFIEKNMKDLELVWNNIKRYKEDKNAFQIEVLKEINIVTEPYRSPLKLTDYAFV